MVYAYKNFIYHLMFHIKK